MAIRMMAPSEIWADYNPTDAPLNITLLDKRGSLELYTFDGAINASPTPIYARVNRARGKGGHTILIAGSYSTPTDESLIDSLLSLGYNVVEIDYTAVFPDTATKYPEEYFYGELSQAGDHLNKITESALDTSLYLYTKVFRRAITFTKELLGEGRVILLGIKQGADVAICVAGLDKRTDGLICLNGAAYSEYLAYNYHDPSENLEKDEERIAYLMGVSSSAYAKLIKCPVVIALGSNSENADIDRLANFLSLFDEDIQRTLTITPRARDYIDNLSYNVIKTSIERIIKGQPLALNPLMKEKYQDGVLYFYITEREGLAVESVGIYSSRCENNRRYRNFVYQTCQMAGVGEYIGQIDLSDVAGDILAFGEIVYEDGSRLSTLPIYVQIEETEEKGHKRLIYSSSDKGHSFAAVTDLPVLFGDGIKRTKNKLGVTELASTSNELITYEIGEASYIKEGTLLQIEIKSTLDNYIELVLGQVIDGELKEYFLELEVDQTGETFDVFTLEAQDSKDKELIALKDFCNIKYIRIKGERPFAIGNIILI